MPWSGFWFVGMDGCAWKGTRKTFTDDVRIQWRSLFMLETEFVHKMKKWHSSRFGL